MTDKITTTLAKIRANSPCADGYKKLCKNLGADYGEDTTLTFKQIYDSNGYDDTLWCLRATDEKYWPLWRHFAVDCAESVEQTDQRCIDAIAVARRFADGEATEEERNAAERMAWDVARSVADSAARNAARSAAESVAKDAAAAAWNVADSAARNAAMRVARSVQMGLLFQYCKTGKRVKSKRKKVA